MVGRGHPQCPGHLTQDTVYGSVTPASLLMSLFEMWIFESHHRPAQSGKASLQHPLTPHASECSQKFAKQRWGVQTCNWMRQSDTCKEPVQECWTERVAIFACSQTGPLTALLPLQFLEHQLWWDRHVHRADGAVPEPCLHTALPRLLCDAVHRGFSVCGHHTGWGWRVPVCTANDQLLCHTQ